MTKNVRGFVRKKQEQSLLNSVDGVSHKVHFKSSEKMKEVKKESGPKKQKIPSYGQAVG